MDTPRRIKRDDAFAALPPPFAGDLLPTIRSAAASSGATLVVLDDDPTGTQTVHDVPVLTEWTVDAFVAEFKTGLPCFFVLTNSRGMAAPDAPEATLEIARNLRAAAAAAGRRFTVVSRSDSTLRGHFPVETDALDDVLGPFDATILVPYFEEGGRYTIHGIHYVAEGEWLVPAAETPFARDGAFGYCQSDLKQWVEEKTGSQIRAGDVVSVDIEALRRDGPEAVAEQLRGLPRGTVCVVDAACPRDLEVFVAGSLAAEAQGQRFLFRTAASFVSTRLGLAPRPLLDGRTLALARGGGPGLIVVGSYVPSTTAQLQRLLSDAHLDPVELNVERLLCDQTRSDEISSAARRLDEGLSAGRDVVVFTSRALMAGAGVNASLAIGRNVSDALVEVVRRLKRAPAWVIAKGGITSSDVATRALGVKRAIVAGRILPGVPVWTLGNETPLRGLAYVVFPGNVGAPDALSKAYASLKGGTL